MTRTTNARLAGSLFLLYIGVGVTQMVLAGGTGGAVGAAARLARIAQHAPQVRANIVLTLLTAVIALALAVALYALTRDVDRDLAALALCCRVGEGLVAAIAPLASLGLLWLATAQAGPDPPEAAAAHALAAYLFKVRGWNVILGATLFAVGSTLFSWLLLRGRLIPLGLAWLGVIASILLAIALPLELVGVLSGSTAQALWIPMAAFEVPLGLWLIVRGVRAPVPA